MLVLLGDHSNMIDKHPCLIFQRMHKLVSPTENWKSSLEKYPEDTPQAASEPSEQDNKTTFDNPAFNNNHDTKF